MTHICHHCTDPIPTGLAHLRSDGHELRAYCGHCLDLLRAAAEVAAPQVPVQRVGGTLAERLAAARVAS